MSGEWVPGDVAMVPFPGREVRCFRTEQGWLRADLSDGGHPVQKFMDPRPLAVIDPEDAEQVERLAKLLWPHYSDVESARLCKTEITADALREFANPTPRIEEPTGLGAVVELADGRQAVRTWETIQPWSHFDDGLPYLDRWDGIDAVRILSPGVPS